jgi:phosphoglycerol transferase MdoB-like AlkP superfamily enzyme
MGGDEMGDSTSSASGGIVVFGLLGVAFVALKLTGFIDWSWWWVTAPFWGGFAIFIIVLLALLGASGILSMVNSKR